MEEAKIFLTNKWNMVPTNMTIDVAAPLLAPAS